MLFSELGSEWRRSFTSCWVMVALVLNASLAHRASYYGKMWRPSQQPTCRAEEKGAWLAQEVEDLIRDGHLSLCSGAECVLVCWTHVVVDIIEEEGEGCAAKVRHLEQRRRWTPLRKA